MRLWFRIVRIAVWLLILAVILALVWLRVLGIPRQLQQRFTDELRKKGVSVQFGKIFFDPFEGFVATDAVLFNPRVPGQKLVSIDEINLKLNYQNLRRKEQAIEELRVDGAMLTLPLDLGQPDKYSITGKDVAASFRLKEDGVLAVENFTGEFNGIKVALSGTARLFYPSGELARRLTAVEGARPNLLAVIVAELEHARFAEPPEVNIQFHADLIRPELSTARAQVRCGQFRHKKVLVDSVETSLTLENQVVQLQRFVVRLYKGEITLTGEYDWTKSLATIEARSNTDPKRIAMGLEQRWSGFFRFYEMAENPKCAAKMEVNPQELGTLVADGTIEWNRFKFRGVGIDTFRSKFSLRDGIFKLLNFEGTRPEGGFQGTYTCRLATEDFTVDAFATVHPALVRGIFPHNRAEFLHRFRFDAPPQVIFLWNGNWRHPEAIQLKGQLKGGSFRIDNVPMQSIAGDAEVNGSLLSVTNLVLTREEGDVRGHLTYDIDRGPLRGRLVSTANPYDLAQAIGTNALATIKPYQFIQPPTVELEGGFNFKNPAETDVRGHLKGNNFYYWRIKADAVETDLHVRHHFVTLSNFTATVYTGKVDGGVRIHFAAAPARYEVDVRAEKVDLAELTEALTLKKRNSTGRLSGWAEVEGVVEDWRSVDGRGQIRIEKGTLWEIPVFGELLSSVLNTILPGRVATSTATDARGDFTIERGVAQFSQVTVDAGLTSIIASGRYKLWSGGLDFEVEGRPWNESLVAKPLSLILMPFTKLFTMHLGGTWEKPEWRTLYLPKELFSPFKSLRGDKGKDKDGRDNVGSEALPNPGASSGSKIR